MICQSLKYEYDVLKSRYWRLFLCNRKPEKMSFNISIIDYNLKSIFLKKKKITVGSFNILIIIFLFLFPMMYNWWKNRTFYLMPGPMWACFVDCYISVQASELERGINPCEIRKRKTGVINDPLGQTNSLASNERCFRLKFVSFSLFCLYGRTDNMCENNDPYRPPWLWGWPRGSKTKSRLSEIVYHRKKKKLSFSASRPIFSEFSKVREKCLNLPICTALKWS